MIDTDRESIDHTVGQMMAAIVGLKTERRIVMGLVTMLIASSIGFGVWIVQTIYAQDSSIAVIQHDAEESKVHGHPEIEREVQSIASDVRSIREAREHDSAQLDRMQGMLERIARRR